jgi:hypothetical protein
MSLLLGQLSPRQRDALRGLLASALEHHFAYPLYFDYRRNQLAQRPLDGAKRLEIIRFIQQVSFDAHIPFDSPTMERWIAEALLDFASHNSALASRRASHRRSDLVRRARQVAADIDQQALTGLQQDPPVDVQTERPRMWLGLPDSRAFPDEIARQDHHTQMLALVLARPRPIAPSAAELPAQETHKAPPAMRPQTAAAPRAAFDALAGGAQSGFFGFGRKKAVPGQRPVTPAASATSDLREAPADLLQLYGDYLSDMQPEMTTHETAAYPGSSAAHGSPLDSLASQQAPAPRDSADARTDLQLFYQLRFQIEGYVRKAARSYGLPDIPGDPARLIEALRGSNLVDESDLRMAEGIIALTDRVSAYGAASTNDYRQALMLYLLYHRSHLA